MARTKQTCRKSTCGFLPPRIVEYPLEARNPDGYRDWEIKRIEEELSEEEQSEEQPEAPEEQPKAPAGQQEAPKEQQKAPENQQAAAAGDPDEDPSDDDGDDDTDDEDEDPTPPPTPPQAPQAPPPALGPRWVVYTFVRDGGDGFFHRRLLDVLRGHYGYGSVGVEYQSEKWFHPHYPSFWRTFVSVRVTDHDARAARRISVHDALSDRDSQEAGIADAARQAYYFYRHKYFHEIQDEPERWYPRRRSGETVCTIASLTGIRNPHLVATVALVATLNTELDAVSEENYKLREQLEEERARTAVLEYALGGPRPRPNHYPEDSPPHKRTRNGTPASRTTIDP